MSDEQLQLPRNRHYDRETHLWVAGGRVGSIVRVGIDEIGLESLGELAFVAISDVGTRVSRGEPIGTLEAAKMTTPIVAPVTGTIVAKNDDVLADPLLAGRDPYGMGWLLEIEAATLDADLAELVTGEAALEWARAERARLRSE